MSRVLVVKPIGLKTSPNKYGQFPPGALAICKNVCMRDPGIISSLPARRTYRAAAFGAGTVRGIFPAASSQLVVGDNAGTAQMAWVTTGAVNAVTTTPTGMNAATFAIAKARTVSMRGRYFTTSLNDGVLVLDSEGDTSARAAGIPIPPISVGIGSLTDAAAMAANTTASFRIVIRRTQSDGYDFSSEPSTAIQLTALVGPINPTFTVTTTNLIAGDFIELYRTKAVAVGSSPGGTYFLAQSHVVTAAEIAATSVLITDGCTDAALGDELYTNPGRPVPQIVGVGGAYTNTPPGYSVDAWTFKNRIFYAVQQVIPYVKFRVSGLWGALNANSDRATGIGARTFTGDITSGSPTVLNVSNTRGVVAGQEIHAAGIAVGTTISSIVGTTITLSANASATTVGVSIVSTDQIEVNGVKYLATTLATFRELLSAQAGVIMLSDTAIPLGINGVGNSQTDSTGVGIVLRSAQYGYLSSGLSVTVRATNGNHYAPNLPEINQTAQAASVDERFNRLQWSKDSQPEAVPPQQELFYGNGVHYRGISTRDCVWLFASDGLYRLSGDADDYRVDPVDTRLILAGRNAAAVLNDTVYAYTNRGYVRIKSDGQVEEIARDDISDLLPGAAYADTWATFVACDELHREAWLCFDTGAVTNCYVYSEFTDAFVSVTDGEWTALEYSQPDRSLMIGMATSRDINYFELDTSNNRMSGADVSFQPLMGDGNPFTLKQWQSWDLLFEGVTSPLQASLFYSGISGQANAQVATLPVQGIESRSNKGIPRTAALQNVLQPRLVFGTGSTTQPWSFRGFSVRYAPLSEEAGRRA